MRGNPLGFRKNTFTYLLYLVLGYGARTMTCAVQGCTSKRPTTTVKITGGGYVLDIDLCPGCHQDLVHGSMFHPVMISTRIQKVKTLTLNKKPT